MPNKNKFLKFLLLIGDIFLLYASLLLVLAIRYGDFSFWPGPQTKVFLFHFSFLAFFWIVILYIFDFYEIPPLKKVFDFCGNLLIFIFLASVFGTTYFYLRPEVAIAPKTILILDVLIFSFFLGFWRYIFSRILRMAKGGEKIVIIGFQPGLEELVNNNLISGANYEILAFFSPENSFLEKLFPFATQAKYGVVSDIKKLKKIIEKEKVETVVFPHFLPGNEQLINLVFANLPLKLNYISFADFYENLTKKVAIETVNEAWFLENISRPEKKVDDILKRGFDILFSFVWLLVTVILFPFVAFAIKIDSSGPVLYTQKRIGRDGRTFTLYKFRTMVKNAEQNGPQWAQPNDPRITMVGKVLRKLYLDEFPQFFNILRGDISFVGPRPERPEFVNQLKNEIPYYDIRHIIKPGLTGWAQINYPASTSVEEAKEKFKYDLYYIKNRNFFMDLGIILKTIKLIFRQ